MAMGSQLRDSVPTAKQNYKIDKHWHRTLRQQELQMALNSDRPPQPLGQV